MKLKLAMTLVSALLPLGCGGQKTAQTDKSSGQNESGMTAEEEAANELYLEDVEASAADDQATDTAVDNSVDEDCKGRRLKQMVEMVLEDLDADDSATLSLEEFLAGLGKRSDDADLDDDAKAKITTKMTEDFNKYAGDDALLSSDELTTLLKEVAPRVGRHRQMKFPGQHQERVKQTWEDITTKYDKDGDGLLSQSEYEAMQADREADREKPREARDEKDRGGPRGPGGRGPGGKFGGGGHPHHPPFGDKDTEESDSSSTASETSEG